MFDTPSTHRHTQRQTYEDTETQQTGIKYSVFQWETCSDNAPKYICKS